MAFEFLAFEVEPEPKIVGKRKEADSSNWRCTRLAGAIFHNLTSFNIVGFSQIWVIIVTALVNMIITRSRLFGVSASYFLLALLLYFAHIYVPDRLDTFLQQQIKKAVVWQPDAPPETYG